MKRFAIVLVALAIATSLVGCDDDGTPSFAHVEQQELFDAK